ncbi:MAG: endo-1,4-beta-xylanase [Planctomycetaceae bacterium]
MRFTIAGDERPVGERAFISGADGRIHPTRIDLENGCLACKRSVSESGKLHLSWPVAGFGRPFSSTTSLPERDEPYLLPLELARGKISRLRDQASVWELAGMRAPREFHDAEKAAYRLFSRAAACQCRPEEASRLAQEALAQAYQAAEALIRTYAEQRLSARRRRSPTLPALLGCELDPQAVEGPLGEKFLEAFTAGIVPVRWRDIEPVEGEYRWDALDAQVEWGLSNRLVLSGGPLLDFSADGLPAWLARWSHDFYNMQSFLCDFVETAVARYVGRIRYWVVAAGGNTGGGLGLTEENRLALVAKTLEAARQVDDENQLVIRVAQPGGEYLGRGRHRLSPLQFVDALLRSGVGLSGVELEIAVGCLPNGSACRDPVDFSQLIDHWSLLGVPMHVILAFPSATGPDLHGDPELRVEDDCWKEPWSESAQANWIDQYLPLLMAKQSVTGIFWSHFSDASPHEFPHSGLVDAAGNPKAALERFAHYRQAYWVEERQSSV